MIAIFVFGVMIGLMAINVPIAICTGLATLVGIVASRGMPPMVMVQRMFVGMDTFTLIACPSSSSPAGSWPWAASPATSSTSPRCWSAS